MIYLDVSQFVKEYEIINYLREVDASDTDFFIIFYRWLRYHRTGLSEFECAEYAKDYQENIYNDWGLYVNK